MDDNLFEGLDFDELDDGVLEGEVQASAEKEAVDTNVVEEVKTEDTEVAKEIAPEVKPAKKTKKSKAEKMKDEIKDVVKKHEGNVKAQKEDAEKLEAQKAAEKAAREAERAAKEAEKLAKMVYIDAQNTDDRKKVMDYMKEGRIVVDSKDRPFILAEQQTKLYNPCKPPIHKVYCDELIHVTIRKYWLDLEAMPVGSRTLARTVIWAYHKGYETFSMITEEQLQYLLDNKFINSKQVYYAHHDMSTGASYFLDNDSREPDSNKIATMEAHEMKCYQALNGKSKTVGDIPENIEEEEPSEENPDVNEVA